MKIVVAFALLFGATGSHASKVFDKVDAMRVVEKMQSMANSDSFHGKLDALREAAGYVKRKEALPEEVKDRLSRRAADDDGDDYQPSCMDSCDWPVTDVVAFCSSKCWESCPSW